METAGGRRTQPCLYIHTHTPSTGAQRLNHGLIRAVARKLNDWVKYRNTTAEIRLEDIKIFMRSFKRVFTLETMNDCMFVAAVQRDTLWI